MRIKIYGITLRSQGIAIAELGASTLRFICVPISHHYVISKQIRMAVFLQPSIIDKIGIFANILPEEVSCVMTGSELTGIQLSLLLFAIKLRQICLIPKLLKLCQRGLTKGGYPYWSCRYLIN
ncbi:Phosphoribosylanthranilate isomerase [Richelia intracellularis HM01]|uniref:phosphoribosylanthranilate isomerase n=1 Tax=Richelia intracellularis TaxID=1164990 RepID=UPI0002B5BBFB|nr:Phosphoribosylanthranilate isomerase [Richelia intracellularis HM01]